MSVLDYRKSKLTKPAPPASPTAEQCREVAEYFRLPLAMVEASAGLSAPSDMMCFIGDIDELLRVKGECESEVACARKTPRTTTTDRKATFDRMVHDANQVCSVISRSSKSLVLNLVGSITKDSLSVAMQAVRSQPKGSAVHLTIHSPGGLIAEAERFQQCTT